MEDGKNWGKSREKCVNCGAATRSIVTRREKKGKRGGKERERQDVVACGRRCGVP